MSDTGSDFTELSDSEDPLILALDSADPNPIDLARAARSEHTTQYPDLQWLSALEKRSSCDALADVYEDFRYAPLRGETNQIRLLHVAPGTNTDDIVCELKAYELHTAPRYSAISYMWSSPDTEHAIFVNHRMLLVGESCWYALWQARNSYQSEFYWIDAVCINQSHLPEKEHQVRFMGDIFRRASSVLACIGSHAENSERLMKFWMDRNRQSPDDHCPDPEWVSEAHISFGKRAYWNRAWIVQELLLAADILLLCGKDICPLEHVALSIAMCPDYSSDECLSSGSECGPRPINQWIDTDMVRLVNLKTQFSVDNRRVIARRIRNRIQRRLHDRSQRPVRDELRRSARPVAQMLREMVNRQCRDPRDRIYSMLQLVDWTGWLSPLKPDYSISHMQLAVMVLARYPGLCEHLAKKGLIVKALGAALDLTYEQLFSALRQTLRLRNSQSALVDIAIASEESLPQDLLQLPCHVLRITFVLQPCQMQDEVLSDRHYTSTVEFSGLYVDYSETIYIDQLKRVPCEIIMPQKRTLGAILFFPTREQLQVIKSSCFRRRKGFCLTFRHDQDDVYEIIAHGYF